MRRPPPSDRTSNRMERRSARASIRKTTALSVSTSAECWPRSRPQLRFLPSSRAPSGSSPSVRSCRPGALTAPPAYPERLQSERNRARDSQKVSATRTLGRGGDSAAESTLIPRQFNVFNTIARRPMPGACILCSCGFDFAIDAWRARAPDSRRQCRHHRRRH